MIDHAFEGFEPTPQGVEAICSCGERRERATDAKARAALNVHMAREELAAGRQRARTTE